MLVLCITITNLCISQPLCLLILTSTTASLSKYYRDWRNQPRSIPLLWSQLLSFCQFRRGVYCYSWWQVWSKHFILSFKSLGIIYRKGFSKMAKFTEISAFSENCFFGNKTQVISNGHWMTSEAYFIKWTTSGEPPVCLKNPFCSYFGSNKQ